MLLSTSCWTRKWEKGSWEGRYIRCWKEREKPCECWIKERVSVMTRVNNAPPKTTSWLADYSELLHLWCHKFKQPTPRPQLPILPDLSLAPTKHSCFIIRSLGPQPPPRMYFSHSPLLLFCLSFPGLLSLQVPATWILPILLMSLLHWLSPQNPSPKLTGPVFRMDPYPKLADFPYLQVSNMPKAVLLRHLLHICIQSCTKFIPSSLDFQGLGRAIQMLLIPQHFPRHVPLS